MATLSALLEGQLAPFLASHLPSVLPHLLAPAVLASRGGGTLPSLAELAGDLRSRAADAIPPRLLLPGLLEQLQPAVAAGGASVTALLATVGDAVEGMDSAAAAQHSAALFDFLLDGMDIRRRRPASIKDQDRLDSDTLRWDARQAAEWAAASASSR